MKSGFVCILGKPNVGKSTLINAIIKEKVAIVSPKPQTTRDKILGILNEDDYQIIFIDTPGIHTSNNKLDNFMEKSINNAKKDVEVIVLVLDGSKRIGDNEFNFVKSYENSQSDVILVINKVDLTKFEKMYPILDRFNKLSFLKDIIPMSAKNNKNVDVLVDKIKSLMPEGERYFFDDNYTDKSVRYLVCETIREKALWLLNDEIPHGIAVEILNFNEGKNLVEIDADIICEKPNHKQIIIGKNGNMLKEIGTKSREDIEKMVDKKVMLKLFVKVRNDWRNNDYYLKDLGYKSEN